MKLCFGSQILRWLELLELTSPTGQFGGDQGNLGTNEYEEHHPDCAVQGEDGVCLNDGSATLSVAARANNRRRVRRALEYLDLRACEPVSIDEIAEVAALSKFHFLRVYEQFTGETIGVTRRRLRLDMAMRMLVAGSSVADAAAASGYGSAQSFGLAFRTHFGRSPGRIVAGSGPPALPGRIVQLPRLVMPGVNFTGKIEEVHDEFDRLIARCEASGATVHPPSIMGTIDGESLGEDGRTLTMNCMLEVDAAPVRLSTAARPGGTYLALRQIGKLPSAPKNLSAHFGKLRDRRLRPRKDFVLCIPARDPSLTAPSERVWDVFYPLDRY